MRRAADGRTSVSRPQRVPTHIAKTSLRAERQAAGIASVKYQGRILVRHRNTQGQVTPVPVTQILDTQIAATRRLVIQRRGSTRQVTRRRISKHPPSRITARHNRITARHSNTSALHLVEAAGTGEVVADLMVEAVTLPTAVAATEGNR
jgi:hypothetical protein